ncbi:hypothetical protein [Alteribacillus iranensis]|uniref:Uncharacterized protein n=1 Tax=Alteribacillus iranensis TaxID=930128 RepID=A0A1I2CKJ1_9BACI|nr:hypothetical protein [Alteribacillus iranensis]SFE68230.1 hypothetical protein SAMN05192532_10326 [Alteribacillus iranensis]
MDVAGKGTQHELVSQKVEKIRAGYSAFAETKDMIDSIRSELHTENIPVTEEQTDQGCWFIPVNKKE